MRTTVRCVTREVIAKAIAAKAGAISADAAVSRPQKEGQTSEAHTLFVTLLIYPCGFCGRTLLHLFNGCDPPLRAQHSCAAAVHGFQFQAAVQACHTSSNLLIKVQTAASWFRSHLPPLPALSLRPLAIGRLQWVMTTAQPRTRVHETIHYAAEIQRKQPICARDG